MKMKVWILGMAVLLAALGFGRPGNAFAATPDDKPASEVAVKIDNFSFSPATITVPAGNDHPLDEPRRHPAHRGERRQDFQIEGARYRRAVHLHLHQGRALTATSARIHPKMTAKVVVQ